MGLRRKSLQKLARATAEICRFEPLENRQMLTTLSGGDVFDYKDSNGDLFRITLRGNVDAEFVGAAVDDNNNVTLGDLVPASAPDDVDGSDLFHVYVRNADWNASISVEGITIDNNGRVTHRPFNGNVSLNVTNARNGRDLNISTNGGTGQAYLGARTNDINGQNNSGDRPITSAGLSGQIGILPRDSGNLSAGLVVANGENLGKFLFDGTVTGMVDIGGSMNMFYAGNVLTGTTSGAFISGADSSTPNNFNVDGDLHNLVVSGSVGTDTDNGLHDPDYLTRFQMRVGGHLGHVDVTDDFVGTVNANRLARYAVDQPQDEVESRGEAPSFVNGFLNDTESNGDNQFHNDTFATAQVLGTVRDGIRVIGGLTAIDRDNYRDWVDYYGVSLLAGQTVTVQLTDTTTPGFNLLNVGVYDPDGRLIATDYSDVDPTAVLGKPFRFTADRPGVYRFAVAEPGDGDFNGGAGFAPSGHVGHRTYELRLTGAGNIAIGGVTAGGNVLDPEVSINGFTAGDGDIGTISAGGTAIFQFKALDAYSVATADGSLRSIDADNIGRLDNNAVVGGPDLSIRNGNVGLLRASNGVLGVNPSSMLLPSDAETPRNYQLVSAGGRFQGALIADQKIGVVRAGDMATLLPSVFTANADNAGGDGVIDLIDVNGNFGTIQGGGPQITTGPKGNVRYINVGGDLFRDEAFGGGRPDLTVFNAGQTAQITDDSGAVLRISPGSGATGTGATLGVLTYGIRGSGGSAIVRLESTGSVNINASARGNSAPAEIGTVLSTGIGRALILGPNGRLVLAPGPDLSVYVGGKSRVDILNVRGNQFTSVDNNTSGEIVSIFARSIGNLEAESLGVAKSSTGTAILPYNLIIPGAVYPYEGQRTGIVVGDIMNAKAYGAMGNLIVNPAMAGGGTGTINSVVADSNSKRGPDASAFEGIVGPVYASGPMFDVSIGQGILPSGNGNSARAGVFAGGQIGTLRGKKGASIRGNVISETGITKIDLVNGGSIINANIMVPADLEDSREFVPTVTYSSDNDSVDSPQYEIGLINVAGDARNAPMPTIRNFSTSALRTTTSGNQVASTAARTTSTSARRPSTSRTKDDGGRASENAKKKKKGNGGNARGGLVIGGGSSKKRREGLVRVPRRNPNANPGPRPAQTPKTVNRGGIIGSMIGAADIGATTVRGGGFGIINSTWAVPGNGVIDKLHAEGYGLRDVTIFSGARIGDIIAAGDGSTISTNAFKSDVKLSETENIDPYYNFAPNTLTDLHAFLGTSKSRPTINGVTESGVISGVSAVASRNLNSLMAYRLIGSNNPLFPTLFNFANEIKKIQITDTLADVSIITGSMDSFKVGRDVNNLDMTVAGTIRSIDIGGSYNAASRIRAIGPDGSIDNIFVNGNLNGDISAENEVGRLRVNGSYNGSVTENGVRVQDS
jgi:hypothetical protein